jgi:antitoxin HigA-1
MKEQALLDEFAAIMRAGRARLTAATALRVGRLTGTGPDIWADLQTRYDLSMERWRLGSELEKVPELAES